MERRFKVGDRVVVIYHKSSVPIESQIGKIGTIKCVLDGYIDLRIDGEKDNWYYDNYEIELVEQPQTSLGEGELIDQKIMAVGKSLRDCDWNKTKSVDKVNPPHYKKGEVECIEAIKAATVGKNGVESYLVGNIIKYLWRYEDKGGLEDLKKGLWYLNKLIDERTT